MFKEGNSMVWNRQETPFEKIHLTSFVVYNDELNLKVHWNLLHSSDAFEKLKGSSKCGHRYLIVLDYVTSMRNRFA